MKSETRTYRVKGGEHERFPGPIANMFLDQMSKLVSQDEEKFQFMIDFSLRAQYYDQLTVSVEDLIHTYTPQKEYLNGQVEEEATEEAEVPFAEAKKKPGRPPKVPATEA